MNSSIIQKSLIALMLWLVGPVVGHSYDIVIYGGTSAAISAAIQAKRMGKTVVIVSPDRHLGGLTSGGLGFTDSGNKEVIGGISREFYQDVYEHYSQPEAWKQQTRESYGNRGQGHLAREDDQRTMWVFEPHVAESIFERWVAENDIEVVRNAWLDRTSGVEKSNGRIVSITTIDGRRFAGKMFLDATYEGDLMAAAGVQYAVGRESMDHYDEPHNGVQTNVRHHAHHFGVLDHPVDPYKTPGDRSSGLLPLISADPPGDFGDADSRVQAYCFRTCMTDFPGNRIPFPKPEGYDPSRYSLLARCFEAGWTDVTAKFDLIPNRKTDTNNHGPVSFDYIGANYDYPEASYERRREIIADHEQYQKGMLYFLANDPQVPKEIRDEVGSWGLAADEFLDNGNWPHQLYVREARRLVGDLVLTENHLTKRIPTPDSIGMGSYTIDSHNVQRYVTPEGHVDNEGDIGVSTRGPYAIAKGSVLPKREQCENLLVPVCVSSSHIAFGSIRMEPVFLILGQSTATIAAIAIDQECAVQDVSYESIRERLLADKQVLEYEGPVTDSHGATYWKAKSDLGPLVDDRDAKRSGRWVASQASDAFFDDGYMHDNADRSTVKSIEYSTLLPNPGRYEVRVSFPPNANRSTRTPITITHIGGTSTQTVDQRKSGPIEGQRFVSLGTFEFSSDQPARVTISNKDADGYVVADAVQWVPAKK